MTPHLIITPQGGWFRKERFPAAIGKNGIGTKEGEGDNITPEATLILDHILYRADRLARPATCLPTRPIHPGEIWSDDPRDPNYNQPSQPRGPTAFSHEKLRRADPLYDIIGVLRYNWPEPTPGKGSAIFLHIWRSPHTPTAGCIALERRALLYVLAHWQPESRIITRNHARRK